MEESARRFGVIVGHVEVVQHDVHKVALGVVQFAAQFDAEVGDIHARGDRRGFFRGQPLLHRL